MSKRFLPVGTRIVYSAPSRYNPPLLGKTGVITKHYFTTGYYIKWDEPNIEENFHDWTFSRHNVTEIGPVYDNSWI